jgi:hypothetical protein
LHSSSFDRPKLVDRKFKDCDPTTAKVLLIGETLIGCDEQIKLRFSKSE